VNEEVQSSVNPYGTPPAPPSSNEPTLGVKIFIAVVIIGFGAAGFGGIKTFLDNKSTITALRDHGISEDASVLSVTEVTGRRIETYHRINIAFDPSGPDESQYAEVLDCSGNRYERSETARVLYLPEDPASVRLDACMSSFDTNILPGLVGLVFGGLALFILWRTRRIWV
jgi:hypothetical protein